jgi:hypothetical protein
MLSKSYWNHVKAWSGYSGLFNVLVFRAISIVLSERVMPILAEGDDRLTI